MSVICLHFFRRCVLLINISTKGFNLKLIYGNSITDGSDSDRYHLISNQSLGSEATYGQQEKKKYLEQHHITNIYNLPKIPHRIHQVWNNYNIQGSYSPYRSNFGNVVYGWNVQFISFLSVVVFTYKNNKKIYFILINLVLVLTSIDAKK